MNKIVKTVLGALVSAVCLWAVFRQFNFSELGGALRSSIPLWFLASAGFAVLSQLLRSIRWRILVSPLADVPLRRMFPILVVGNFTNNVLPARTGEFVRSYALHRETGLPVTSCIGTVVVERLNDFVGLFYVILLSSRLLPWNAMHAKTIVTSAAIGLGIAIALLVFIHRQREKLVRWPGIVGKLAQLVVNTVAGFVALRSFSKMAGVLALTIGIWTVEVLCAFSAAHGIRLPINFFGASALIVGIAVGVMIPAAPGFIGTYEMFGRQTLVLLGFPADLSLTCVLILHFITIVVVAILGVPSVMEVGMSAAAPEKEVAVP